MFQDYGTGKLSNGITKISIDPILRKNIRVDTEHPLKVFIQLEGDCNGVFVTDKSKNGFTVKELKGGKSNVPFSWSIVATRANEEIRTKNGNTRISNNSVRFPAAPGPMKKNETKSTLSKFKNTVSKKLNQENIEENKN